MPNHIQNNLKFKATDEQFDEIVNLMYGEESEFDFNNLIPMPDGVDWYSWCCANWNTKWNSYEVEIDPEEKTIRFLTAWSSVPPIVRELSMRFPKVKITYSWSDEDIGRNLGKAVYLGGKKVSEIVPESFTKEAYRMAFKIWQASPSDFEMHFSKKADNYIYND